jgi:hypothetical protein
MSARLLTAAAAVDDYFAGRMGAIVADEVRQAILAELSAAVAEAKAGPNHFPTCGAYSLGAGTAAAIRAARPAHF